MQKSPTGTRFHACRACGRKFEYPVKGSGATRHHCEDCAVVPPETRKVIERLTSRIQRIELALEQLAKKEKPAGTGGVCGPEA